MANDRGRTQPWTEWITRADDGPAGEYTLACRDGAVTTEDLKQTYPPNQALGLFVSLRTTTDLSAEDVAITAMRMLLGRLMRERLGCHCSDQPFVIVREDDEWWVEDWR